MRVDNTIFTKNEKNLHAKQFEDGLKRESPRKVPRSPPLKTHHCTYL